MLSRYSGKVTQSQGMPAAIVVARTASLRSSVSMARSRSSGLTGAKPKPQLPITTDVTPCQPDIVHQGSQKICESKWVCRSMTPGATIRSFASNTRFASDSETFPICAMRPSAIATSPV